MYDRRRFLRANNSDQDLVVGGESIHALLGIIPRQEFTGGKRKGAPKVRTTFDIRVE